MNGLFVDTGQTAPCCKHYFARGDIHGNPIKLELLRSLAMPIYDRHSISKSIGRGTLDPELEQWLPQGLTLGTDVSTAQDGAIMPSWARDRGPASGP